MVKGTKMHPTEAATALTKIGKKMYHEKLYESAKEIFCVASQIDPYHSPAAAWNCCCIQKTEPLSAVLDFLNFDFNIVVYQNCLSAERNDALFGELKSKINYAAPNPNMPIYKGTLSQEISLNTNEISHLKKTIAEYFVSYIAQTGRYGLLGKTPADLELALWATQIAPGGSIAAHYHIHSWLTAIYYPQESEKGYAALELGPMPSRMGGSQNFPIFQINPEKGTLVIFPSFVGHRVPVHLGRKSRFSVACDLLAVPK
jgi:hypothetical protein